MKKAQSESGTILVVSSDEAICNVIRQALERAGYRVLEVRDAKTALEICRQPLERIDLLLTEATRYFQAELPRGMPNSLLPFRSQVCGTSNQQMEQLRLCRKIHQAGTIEDSITCGHPTDL